MIVLESVARRAGSGLLALGLLLGGCGDGGSEAEGTPTVAVTTSVLADVVGELLDEQADVLTVMPTGVDPHEFQASAQEANRVRGADALVVNGGGLEEGLLDLVDAVAADGVPVHEAVSGDDEGGAAAHFFTDPTRMADAVERISAFLAEEVPGVDAGALDASTDEYLDALAALDAEVEAQLARVPAGDRVLVTGHDVLGAFADRYGFEVVGTVVPGGSTTDGASGGDLARLASVIRDAGVRAVFVDESAADELARTLAEEAGDVEVVALFTESLGDEGSGAGSYLEMIRTNARRIAAALAPGAP